MNTSEHTRDCRGTSLMIENDDVDPAHLARTADAIGAQLHSHVRPDEVFLVHIVACLTTGILLADEIGDHINAFTDHFDPYGQTAQFVRRCLLSEGPLLLQQLTKYFRKFPEAGRTPEDSAHTTLQNAVVLNRLASDF